MPKPNLSLPHHQSIHLKDKPVWEMMRMTAQLKGLSISELGELAIKFFMQHPDRDRIIEYHKIQSGLK